MNSGTANLHSRSFLICLRPILPIYFFLQLSNSLHPLTGCKSWLSLCLCPPGAEEIKKKAAPVMNSRGKSRWEGEEWEKSRREVTEGAGLQQPPWTPAHVCGPNILHAILWTRVLSDLYFFPSAHLFHLSALFCHYLA